MAGAERLPRLNPLYYLAVAEPGQAEPGQAVAQPMARRDPPVQQLIQLAVCELPGQVLVEELPDHLQRLLGDRALQRLFDHLPQLNDGEAGGRAAAVVGGDPVTPPFRRTEPAQPGRPRRPPPVGQAPRPEDLPRRPFSPTRADGPERIVQLLPGPIILPAA